MAGFDSEMSLQKERARKAGDFESKKSLVVIENPTEFLGYDHFDNNATITAIIKNNESINELSEGQEAIVILDQSSFYGESGGQVGDQGTLSNKSTLFKVSDTQKQASSAFEHFGILDSGSLKVGDKVLSLIHI